MEIDALATRLVQQEANFKRKGSGKKREKEERRAKQREEGGRLLMGNKTKPQAHGLSRQVQEKELCEKRQTRQARNLGTERSLSPNNSWSTRRSHVA